MRIEIAQAKAYAEQDLGSLLLPETARVSLRGAILSRDVYLTVGHTFGLGLALAIVVVGLAWSLQHAISNKAHFVVTMSTVGIFALTVVQFLRTTLLDLGVYASWMNLLRHQYGFLIIGITTLQFVAVTIVIAFCKEWAQRWLDVSVYFSTIIILNGCCSLVEMYNRYDSPQVQERLRREGRSLPGRQQKGWIAMRVSFKCMILVGIVVAFQLAMPQIERSVTGYDNVQRSFVLFGVFCLKIFVDVTLRIALTILIPKLPIRTVDEILFFLDGFLMWGMRAVLTGSQDITFTVVSSALFSIGEIVVAAVYLWNTARRWRKAATTEKKRMLHRELQVKLVNFHGDIVLEVFIGILYVAMLLIFRRSTILSEFGASGVYLNTSGKVVSMVLAQLIPDTLGDFFIVAMLR